MKLGQGFRLLIGLAAVFALFQWLGDALGSDRGQSGVLIGLIVVAATLGAETALFGRSLKEAARALGLRTPAKRGILAAVAISLLLLLTIPLFASVMNVSFSFYDGWIWLVPGLFFQAGIAEETLFRGYLFGHLRRRHSFWKAAFFAAIPFILVHLILFYSLPWSLAGASILLAVAMSFPLSRLFEMGGDSMWAPAIVHFTAQASVKVLTASGEAEWLFPFFWIAACALIPLGVFLMPYLFKEDKRPVKAFAALCLLFLLAIPSVARDGKTDAETEKDFGRRKN